MNWVAIIAIVLSLITAGCADVADAEDSTATTPAETQKEARTNLASDDTTWIAVVMTWNPVHRVIDKEFTTEVECWNYYENGVGEGKFGSQHRDHQDNLPTKDFHFGPDYLEYPIRTYRGINDEQGQVWLTCDLKGRYGKL